MLQNATTRYRNFGKIQKVQGNIKKHRDNFSTKSVAERGNKPLLLSWTVQGTDASNFNNDQPLNPDMPTIGQFGPLSLLGCPLQLSAVKANSIRNSPLPKHGYSDVRHLHRFLCQKICKSIQLPGSRIPATCCPPRDVQIAQGHWASTYLGPAMHVRTQKNGNSLNKMRDYWVGQLIRPLPLKRERSIIQPYSLSPRICGKVGEH